jgi:cytochrome P450
VFQQTVGQAKAMLASFIHDADGKESSPGREPVVKDLIRWTMTLTLNVISGASFNLKAGWPTKSVAAEDKKASTTTKKELSEDSSSHERSLPFQESFTLVMNNIRILIGTPTIILRNSPFRHLLKASDDFQFYMREMIEGYRKAEQAEKLGEAKVNAGDLLSNIVKASAANNSMSMSESEVIGNIYIFVLAGHETTASTLKTGLIRLACDPELQMQVQKEIDGIWATKRAGEDLSYDDYPKMRKIMALMVSTLVSVTPF